MDLKSIKSLLFDEEDEMELVESVSSDEDDVGEDWSKKYGGISEFIADLGKEADLECEALERGYVLFEKHPQQPQQQLHLRQFLTTLFEYYNFYYKFPDLVQFWGVTKVEGSHHYLSTKHQPFFVDRPKKGFSFYRKLCRNHVYDVDVQDDEDNRNIGGVGRAYRNNHLESTPDLRLYSTHQFPMRHQAARCGFRGYMALPLFDSHTNQSHGVLEILQSTETYRPMRYLFLRLDKRLQIAGLRSTHNSVSTSNSPPEMQLESEIKEILELIVETIPGLYLAHVWVPCQHCVKKSANLGCMGMSISFRHRWKIYDLDVDENYLEACEFHNLQLDLGSFDSLNSYDVSITKYPLAHYAHKARFTHSFSMSLESLDNSKHPYLVQFFHQPKFRQDAYGDNSLQLLLKIMEMNLKSFKFVLRGQLLEESQRPYAIPHGSIKSLKEMMSYEQECSKSEFITYLKTDSYFHPPSSEYTYDGIHKWVFCSPADGDLVHIPVKEKINNFMKDIVEGIYWGQQCRIIQFWVPKMDENRCYLETSNQPYVVSCFAKGLASYRKKCVTHQYVVDEEAKEEELGPPGRVFKSRQPEVTPDLFHYTTKEFPIRNYAMHCCTRPYLAFPIFDDQQNHKCVGVLEFLGFSHYDLERIRGKLEDAELCSSHIGLRPRFLDFDQPPNTLCRRKFAPSQLKDALELMLNSVLQLYMANVWVPNGECDSRTNSDMSCMELVYSTNDDIFDFSPNQAFWIHVQARKGMIGMVLASENKSSFCQNLCGFGIADQPMSHFEMSVRCNVCFAICLQSSETDDLYVVEFFPYPGPPSYEYLRSFLNVLLPIMKGRFKSFKLACGKELGEELVIEVIEFSEANKLVSSDESEQPDVFPFKFKSVQYPRNGHPPTEEQQTEEHIVAALDLNRKEKGKRKTGLHLNLETLKRHFGKKLKDVAEELGVGRSTIKRACRDYGIDRWPSKQKYNKNPSLFERGREMQSSTSNLQPVEKVTESSDHVVALEEAEEKVIVKVRYEEDIIKFDSCVSLRLTTLIEEVATRLNLEKGSFKLKYLDEDGDEILLTIDKDLQDCPKSRTATGKTCIQLFVRR